MDKLPNLFLIGAAKGGSTTFASHLKDHPDIAFFTGKEPNLFNEPSPEACRARLQERLENRKTPLPEVSYLLDASVNYSQYPKFSNVPANIAEICGRESPRFLYMMRNPVDRAISQYFWRRERYAEDIPPEEALDPDSQYVQSSRYDLQIERYLSIFSKAQFRFLDFDSYYADVAGEYAAVCRWLGIDDTHLPKLDLHRGATNKKTTRSSRFPLVNRIARSSPALRRIAKSLLPYKHQLQFTQALSKSVPREDIAPEVRARLADGFADSIARTEALTGLDLSAWKAPRPVAAG